MAEPPLPQHQSRTCRLDDTRMLYEEVRRSGGITIPHTSATGMGTDWSDNDPEIEPLVEIFQGDRYSYEQPGAPLTNGPDDTAAPARVAAGRRLRLERARQGLQAGVHRELRPRLDASLVRDGVGDRSQPPRGARRHARAAHLRRHRQHRARVLDRRPVHGRRAARRRRRRAGDPGQGGGHQAVSHRRDPAQRPADPSQLAGPSRRRAAVPRPRAGRRGRATTTRA